MSGVPPSLAAIVSRSPLVSPVIDGPLVYLSEAVRAQTQAQEAIEGNRFKNFMKRWPSLYGALIHIVGPSLLTGLTSSRFVRRFPARDKILYAGSGPNRIHPDAVNVDFMAFPGVDVIADLRDLPFRDDVFDAVSCEQVLEHIPDVPTVTHELFRVCKPGGLIHIASPFVFPWHPSPSDYHRWTQEGLESLFPSCTLIERGVVAGPCSALTALLACIGGIILSCGSRKLQDIFQYVFLILLIPLKLCDFLVARIPGAELCSASCYVVLRKK